MRIGWLMGGVVLDKAIAEIRRLLDECVGEYSSAIFPDGGVHVVFGVLDLLKLANEGDRFVDVVYRLRGNKIVSREIVKETVKLDKEYADYVE